MLAATHQAAIDEINHARTAFTLDAAKNPERAPFGPAENKGWLGRAGHVIRLHRMAVDTFRDGCLNEAFSAEDVRRKASEEPDAVIRAEIENIAREEDSHVKLSWQIVAWCCREMPDDKHRAALLRALTAILERYLPANDDNAANRKIIDDARRQLEGLTVSQQDALPA